MKTTTNLIKKKEDDLPAYLKLINQSVYCPGGFIITNFRLHKESRNYEACSFDLNGKHIQYRRSKITPSKAGQFVTIWKRNEAGQTEPFEQSDNIHFIVITCVHELNVGHFIFPASVLVEKGIISLNKKGKRGIRVYPPWDKAESSQARKTQEWQVPYFFSVDINGTHINIIRRLLEHH